MGADVFRLLGLEENVATNQKSFGKSKRELVFFAE